MSKIGSFVRHNGYNLFGVVVGWSEENHGYLKVRAWNNEKMEYSTYAINPNQLMAMETLDFVEQNVKETAGFWEAHDEIALEIALQTKDKKWFDEIMERARGEKEGEQV